MNAINGVGFIDDVLTPKYCSAANEGRGPLLAHFAFDRRGHSHTSRVMRPFVSVLASPLAISGRFQQCERPALDGLVRSRHLTTSIMNTASAVLVVHEDEKHERKIAAERAVMSFSPTWPLTTHRVHLESRESPTIF
jgi:hypothetical protein